MTIIVMYLAFSFIQLENYSDRKNTQKQAYTTTQRKQRLEDLVFSLLYALAKKRWEEFGVR